MFRVPEKYRAQPSLGSTFAPSPVGAPYGAFVIPIMRPGMGTSSRLLTLAMDGDPRMDMGVKMPGYGWEHVSVSVRGENRCPTWDEMCHIKNLFWEETDCVMQLHPPVSEYVNNHNYCLHLWRPFHTTIPMPPSICVGVKL